MCNLPKNKKRSTPPQNQSEILFINAYCYTRTEHERDAKARSRAMKLWCKEQGVTFAGFAWDGLGGQRGLIKTCNDCFSDAEERWVVVWMLSDLARGDIVTLVKMISCLIGARTNIRAIATALEITPGPTSEAGVIQALATAHQHYVSVNRKTGVEAARAAGAQIGRPRTLTLDDARKTLERLTHSNKGELPSARDFAKELTASKLPCGATKANQLLQQYKAEQANGNTDTEATEETNQRQD